MKKYLVSVEDPAFSDIEKAIEAAKDCVSLDDKTYYVYELVGAVHPGKPRWRPTERKERVEKPVDCLPKFSDDERLYYKIRVRNYPIDYPVPVAKEIRSLACVGLKEAKAFMDGCGYFTVTATMNEFQIIKSRLETAGATIEYEIL